MPDGLAVRALEALGEGGRADLLRLRPDLAETRTTSLRELAERALDPVSLSGALRAFDVPTLQVAEVLAALGARAERREVENLLGIGPGARDAEELLALDRALDVLRRYLFLQGHTDVPHGQTEPRLLPEIVRAWPEPLGFGPPVRELLANMPVTSLRHGLAALGIRTTKTLKADIVGVLASALDDPVVIQKALDQAPTAVAERVRQAAFGRPLPRTYLVSPYSTSTYGRANADRDPTLWAVAHMFAVQTYEAVVMPAEVMRAIRGPDWHLTFVPEEPALPPTSRAEAAVQREASAAAGNAVRAVTGLIEALRRRPLQRLKTGAVGVRELRRLGKEQGIPVAEVRLALAIAHTAELVEPCMHGVAPTADADAFLRRASGRRAAELMSAWLEVPHLPLLEPEEAWYPHLNQRLFDVKQAVLAALARHPGQAADLAALTRWLEWRYPVVFTGQLSAFASFPALAQDDDLSRGAFLDNAWDEDAGWDEDDEPLSIPVQDGALLVDAVLAEAAWLGVVADGALSRVGGHLLAGDPTEVEKALTSDLGADSTKARLQADLTAVVMGHPAAELSATLDELAARETRSVATTWRFSATSVREALDAGWTADQILDRLADLADGSVPQPLTYLVNDVARRHGHLLGGTAACYLRGDDEALLREVAADRRLAKLGLRLVAPGVLLGERPLAETLADLRRAGYAPVPEDRLGRRIIASRNPYSGP